MLIYLAAGVAFLAVSLWLILSGGKSAKATRAKFRLGGIMLTAWSMISAASCVGVPTVTCYEPAVPPEVTCYDVAMESDIFTVTVKDYGGNKLKPGDTMVFKIQYPGNGFYHLYIHSGDFQSPVIQEFSCTLPEGFGEEYTFEQVLEPTDYRGEAAITVFGVYEIAGGQKQERQVSTLLIDIVG